MFAATSCVLHCGLSWETAVASWITEVVSWEMTAVSLAVTAPSWESSELWGVTAASWELPVVTWESAVVSSEVTVVLWESTASVCATALSVAVDDDEVAATFTEDAAALSVPSVAGMCMSAKATECG